MIKLRAYIKQKMYQFATILVILPLVLLAFYSSLSDNRDSPQDTIIQEAAPSNYYRTSYKKAIKNSRSSAVRLLSLDIASGMVSTFSGTYIKSYGNYFVVTVAHGIQGECEFTKIVYDQNVYECKKYIIVDELLDYAIIQINEIQNRRAIEIPKQLPHNKEWKGVFTLLNRVVYSGYPNSLGPLTISGKVAGTDGGEFIYLDSYAWHGSSGSGVFNSEGKFIGHIVAVDVGTTEFGVQVLNNIVLVTPSYKINWEKTITEAE